MKNIFYIVIMVILFLNSSCILRHTDDVTDLGNNYYFLPDGRSSNIGYNTAKEGENRSGTRLIEPKIVSFNFDKDFIIAKSIGVYDKKVRFWIIDKNLPLKSNVFEFDSIAFYNELSKRQIKLILNN